MHIFLIYPNFNNLLSCGYSVGIGYISAVLKQNGYITHYYHLRRLEDVNIVISDIKKYNPCIIGVSMTTYMASNVDNIIKLIRPTTDAILLCGGTHPTLEPNVLNDIPELDCIIIGEGEYPMLELANSINAGKIDYTIKNIHFKTNKNEVRPTIKNLDDLPFPDRDFEQYQNFIFDDHVVPTAHFIFSRGCPFKCTYCCNEALSKVYPNPSNYYRRRSAKKAIEEIELTASKYYFEEIIFDDDTISLHKPWFFEFFELYKQKFNYPFRCNIRVGTVTEDMIKLLKECGAKDIGVGIEHGNEEFRRNVLNRQMSNDEIIKTFDLLDLYHISHTDFIMTGLPGENFELFKDTVRLCRRIKSYGMIFSFVPYPKTVLGELCKKNGWLPQTNCFKERCEATLTYPDFTKDQIQKCQNIFQNLVANPDINIDNLKI